MATINIQDVLNNNKDLKKTVESLKIKNVVLEGQLISIDEMPSDIQFNAEVIESINNTNKNIRSLNKQNSELATTMQLVLKNNEDTIKILNSIMNVNKYLSEEISTLKVSRSFS